MVHAVEGYLDITGSEYQGLVPMMSYEECLTNYRGNVFAPEAGSKTEGFNPSWLERCSQRRLKSTNVPFETTVKLPNPTK